MDYIHIHAEQVGFITEPQNEEATLRLEMSGGEFCGNGVLAAGALAGYLGMNNSNSFRIESSGVDETLECTIRQNDERSYVVNSSMPLDYNYREWKDVVQGRDLTGMLIEFRGITHLLIQDDVLDDELIEMIVKRLAQQLSVEALGVISYKESTGGYRIKPCVYVPGTGSLVFERGCGSGTLALGLHISNQKKESMELNVKQPGGTIKVEIILSTSEEEIIIEDAFLETEIEITCEGKVLI